MAQSQGPLLEKKEKDVAAAIAAQQSDNIAHALAGAGGGLLSMALTYDFLSNIVSESVPFNDAVAIATLLSASQRELKSNPSARKLLLLMLSEASSNVRVSRVCTLGWTPLSSESASPISSTTIGMNGLEPGLRRPRSSLDVLPRS